MTTRKPDTYYYTANEPVSVCYISDTPGQAPFIHVLPNRVIEPWHFKKLTGTTSVMMVVPYGYWGA